MRREDWKEVIENTFSNVSTNSTVTNGNLEIRDESVKTEIKIPPASEVYSIHKDLEEIQIFTKNDRDINGFSGSHIVISKSLETCMLIDTISVHHIPWDEITTIRVVLHPAFH